MLRIDCPFCGLRNHTEFTYLEDGSKPMPALTVDNLDKWFDAVFLRENPRGLHCEDWHHSFGCRMVVRVMRDTLTHQIISVKPAHPAYETMLSSGQRTKTPASQKTMKKQNKRQLPQRSGTEK